MRENRAQRKFQDGIELSTAMEDLIRCRMASSTRDRVALHISAGPLSRRRRHESAKLASSRWTIEKKDFSHLIAYLMRAGGGLSSHRRLRGRCKADVAKKLKGTGYSGL